MTLAIHFGMLNTKISGTENKWYGKSKLLAWITKQWLQ